MVKNNLVLGIALLLGSMTYAKCPPKGEVGLRARSGFYIESPKPGQPVRETFHVSIPRLAVPKGYYVSFWVDGSFLCAPKPSQQSSFFIYKIPSKQLQIKDGKHKLEAVLFSNNDPKRGLRTRTFVNIFVDNHTSIYIPQEGLTLKYDFELGQQRIYAANITQRSGSTNSAALHQKYRVLQEVENSQCGKSGPEFIIRTQILPMPGTNYVQFVPLLGEKMELRDISQLDSVYFTVDSFGQQINQQLPYYLPFDAISTRFPRLTGYALAQVIPLLPFPVPISKPQKFDNMQNGKADFNLLSVEYEDGLPCAQIRWTSNGSDKDGVKYSQTLTAWFALNKKFITKWDSITEFEIPIESKSTQPSLAKPKFGLKTVTVKPTDNKAAPPSKKITILGNYRWDGLPALLS